MSQPDLVYTTSCQLDAWNQQLLEHLPLSKPKAKALALFSFAMALRKRCTLSDVALALPEAGKADSQERRFQRFLSLGPLKLEACQSALTRWVLQHWPAGERLVLLVDETSLQEHLRVMATAAAYRGRALPLSWQVYASNQVPAPRPCIMELLKRIASELPAGTDVLVQADRGIGCDPELLRFIAGLGWKYLMRVQGQVRLRLAQPGEPAQELIFAQQICPPSAEQASHLSLPEVEAFKKGGWLACRALGLWRPEAKEPWLLVTNCPQVHSEAYGLRMWEEAAFKDFKSNGFQWQRSRVRKPAHAARLWLVMALSYLLALNLGAQTLAKKTLLKQVTRGKGTRRSVFQVGLRALSWLGYWPEALKLLREIRLWPSQSVWSQEQLRILKTVVQ